MGGGETCEGGRGRGGCQIGESKKTHCMRQGMWGCRNEGRKEKRESSRDEIWRLKDESTCEKGLWTNRLTITKEAWVTLSLTAMRAVAAIAVLTERVFKETIEFERAREVSPHTAEVWWVKLHNDSVWRVMVASSAQLGAAIYADWKKVELYSIIWSKAETSSTFYFSCTFWHRCLHAQVLTEQANSY